MATLDDKLLGEKLHYYCSSSDDDEDNSEEIAPAPSAPPARTPTWDGSSVNTGPKGVLKDYQAFQQMERERQKARDAATLEMVKKMSLTCKTLREEEKEAEVPESAEDDPLFRQYLQHRMKEMYKKAQKAPKFGKLDKLFSGDDFLKAADSCGDVTVIVHVWAEGAGGCVAMDGCLSILAPRYPQIHFCSLEASTAGMSQRFEAKGVPALLAYRNGNLIGNFVRLTNNLGEDFYADDLETFLLEHGLLPDKSLIPALIKPGDDDSGED